MPSYQKYRSKLHHLLLIDGCIRRGRFPNSETLAGDLEVSSRTIRRDIEFMRDVLGAPLEFDRPRGGYHYTEPHWSLPGIRLTEGDLLGVALAQLALQAYRGTPLHEYLERVTEKLKAGLPDEVEVDQTLLSDVFQFRLGPLAPFDPSHWETAARAARERKTLRMRYYTMWRDSETDRDLDPYLLRCCCGNWHIVGRDHLSGDVKVFDLARVKSMKATNRSFEPDANFDAEKYFSGAFNLYRSAERHKVRIQFFGVAARLVAERVWHPSQKLTRRSDGSIVLAMTVSDIGEVAGWVLSWGPNAKVLGPGELRKEVVGSADALLEVYR